MKTKTILRTFRFVLGLMFIALLSACQTVADTAGVLGELGVIDQATAGAVAGAADSWSRAQEEITPEQEYYIGRAVGANILTNYKVYQGNPGLTAYLNRICNAIVVNSPKPELFNGYHVAILDSQEINAFSTSGGHIFVTRGLLTCTNSEDTLAAVIAHEIAHIQLQHSIKSIKTSRFTNAILSTANAGATAAGTSLNELTGAFGASVDEAVNTVVNSGYSQTQEYDADSTALALMAAAGYDPASLVAMLNLLREKQPAQGGGGFGKTHPSPANRITSANRTLPSYHVPDTKQFRAPRYQAANK